jgi:Mrp family chromosome partitioning ATPase
MAKRREKTPEIDRDGLILLSAADGALQRVFDAEVVQRIRYMSTELTLNRNLPRRVALIAALRGEGVTYTAVALGAILANDTGARVCVVELNWWAPGLIALLDPAVNTVVPDPKAKKRGKGKQEAAPPVSTALAGRPGLGQVLMGNVPLEEAILHSNMPNFDLIPAGEVPIARRPALARNLQLRALLDQLSATYDHLILDIPAVRTTSDAIPLAALSNACIVVAHQGATSIGSVQQALDDVKSLSMLGVVLNKVDIKTPYWLLNLVPQE